VWYYRQNRKEAGKSLMKAGCITADKKRISFFAKAIPSLAYPAYSVSANPIDKVMIAGEGD
jgi:hypothetical protein